LKAKLRAETADEKLAREIYEHEMKLKHNQELEIQCQPSIPSSSKSSSHLTANPFEVSALFDFALVLLLQMLLFLLRI
jgi:hypothetical protein